MMNLIDDLGFVVTWLHPCSGDAEWNLVECDVVAQRQGQRPG
jgi:hypothetical protein